MTSDGHKKQFRLIVDPASFNDFFEDQFSDCDSDECRVAKGIEQSRRDMRELQSELLNCDGLAVVMTKNESIQDRIKSPARYDRHGDMK